MQTLTNTLRWIAMGAFIIAAGATSYFLIQFPTQMSLQSTTLDIAISEELSPLFLQLYVVVGSTILSGLGVILLSINRKNEVENQIAEFRVSDQQFVDSKEAENQGSVDEFYIGDIEAIISSETTTEAVFNKALSQACNALEASQGTAYRIEEKENGTLLELFASYSYHLPEGDKLTFRLGEGLVGQAAKDGKMLNVDAVPEGYIQIFSGLGKATPKHLLVMPIKEGEGVLGMIELASFKPFQDQQIMALESYFGKLALKLSNSDNVSLEEAKS